MRKIKIVVSAYGCEPNKGSESGTGWFWVERMAKHFEIWVITRKNNECNISNHISDEIKNNIHFVYYDLPEWVKKFKKREKGFYWYYFLWQKGIVKIARKLVKEEKPDYIMHLTFGSVWLPTCIHKLKCPFIWGPIGGGEAIPDCYLDRFTLKSKMVQRLRKILIKCSELNLSLRKRCRKAELIIARTEDTVTALPKKYREKTVVMLETAVADDVIRELAVRKERILGNSQVKILYTGRLIPLKAVDIAISAIGKMKHRERVEFSIIGKGFLKKKLEKQVKGLGLERQVKFIGEISRKEVLEHLKEADIFLFPSLKEGGTWALMEAMTAGLPCVCIDTSGMHVITDKNSAIRVLPQSGEETSIKMAEALDYLIENPEQAIEMGKKARSRIKTEFTWEAKEKFIVTELGRLEEKRNESINAES